LPDGPFDLVASALAVHHLHDVDKAELFGRVRGVLAPGGLFVLGDVVVPIDPAAATTPLTPGYDRPSPLADLLGWLSEAGFSPSVTWENGDLAVVAARVVRARGPGRLSPRPGWPEPAARRARALPCARNLRPDWPLDDNSGDRLHC
jgi:SAM-dependent methyltransferase